MLEQYVTEIRPQFGFDDQPALWLTERGGRTAIDLTAWLHGRALTLLTSTSRSSTSGSPAGLRTGGS